MTRPRNEISFFAQQAIGFVAVALISSLSPAHAATVRMAVMGDSISAGSGVSGGSPNWVAQLNPTGAITFSNKAVGGATSGTVVSGQLSSVVTLAHNGQIADSTLIIGGNDAVAGAINIATGGSADDFINSYVANIKNIISSVHTANPNVHQVFGNMPDVTVTPLVKSQAASNGVTPAQLQLVSNAIAQANAIADQYALSHGVPVVDLFTASRVLPGMIPLTLGGHQFTTMFAPDGFHPAPFVQGLLANMVDKAYNLGFGQNLPILSDQKIVQNVGFTPGSGTSTFDVTPFVLLPTPEPSSLALAAIGGVVLIVAGRRAAQVRRRAA